MEAGRYYRYGHPHFHGPQLFQFFLKLQLAGWVGAELEQELPAENVQADVAQDRPRHRLSRRPAIEGRRQTIPDYYLDYPGVLPLIFC